MMAATMERLRDLTQQQYTEQTATDFARYVKCFVAGRSVEAAAELFEAQYPRAISVDVVKRSVELHTKALELHTKAAVAAGSTVDTSWAKPLVNVRALTDAFVNVLRPNEVLSQLPGRRAGADRGAGAGVHAAGVDRRHGVGGPGAAEAAGGVCLHQCDRAAR